MAVTGVPGTDTVNFDSSVNRKNRVEDCGEGAEDQSCEGRGAELGKFSMAYCEGVCDIEETEGGGCKTRSACRETSELVEDPWKGSGKKGEELHKYGVKSKEGAMANEPKGDGKEVASG